jgi:hypothetical protein
MASATNRPRVALSAARRRQLLHEEAERIAVPTFDWIAAPIDGMADAVSALTHPHRRRPHPQTEEPPAEPV